ncbi:MAG TPA: hypothetical protein PKJ14_05255 [Candidatus Cloacimonadota bacterium]|nr:hypothetical protein [Candidatus Cloacimonadota bacterium]HQL15591.1 hypothetical protein [Candidatus Cloacimonadota bacterium]
MKKLTFVIILALALFLTSCDRFEHTFKPEDSESVSLLLFNQLQAAFDNVDSTGVSLVMEFYADDYLHNGQQKADREQWYHNLLSSYPSLKFEVNLLNPGVVEPEDTLSVVNWQLKVKDAAQTLIADSTFTGEKIIKRHGKWLLYGNRVGCCPPPQFKQRVFIEMFTYTTCPNCPAVEALLHHLQQTYPNNLTYLEYHLGDALDIGNSDVYSYYGYPAMPSAVFQGENMIIGNNTDNEQIFNQLAAQISATDAAITLTNLDYTLTGQTLNGSVQLNFLTGAPSTANLKLKYAILDKESAAYTNHDGEPCRNVVLAKGSKNLAGIDTAQPVTFSLPITGTLPADSYLTVWVQTLPSPFDHNAKVFNALEAYLSVQGK